MENLYSVLKDENYKKIKFKISRTQHLLIKAKINGIEGIFILDTGASNSCVGFESIPTFLLNAKKSKTKASGAGGTGMFTQIAKKNNIQIGKWEAVDTVFVIFDMSHVNEALLQHHAKVVHGIIGADLLQKGKAIIDYYNHCLYLKQL
jgi:hypothetical protein